MLSKKMAMPKNTEKIKTGYKAKQKFWGGVTFICLVLLSFIVLVPFIWMISSSLKTDIEVFNIPFEWIPSNPQWRNYIDIWTTIPMTTYLRNTTFLTIIITFLQLFTSSFAAYGFSRMRFRGRDTLFLAYLGTIAVPWQAFMIPQFILMRNLGLTNTLWALVLLQAFSAFGVFLMRQSYLSIPEELSEAARIDGLSEYGIYFKIILPLVKPTLATLTIFTMTFVWNDFMGPFIYLSSSDLFTIQIGLRNLVGQFSAQYALIMTGSVLSILPIAIVFLCAQRYFIEGIASSGVKG